MQSSEKSLLYEIKERVVRIEDKLTAQDLKTKEIEVITKENKEKVDKFEDKINVDIIDFNVRISKYDNYFKLRNEIKNAAIVILVGLSGSMLTYIFLK